MARSVLLPSCRNLGAILGTRIQLCGRVVATVDGRRVDGELPGRQGRLLFAYLEYVGDDYPGDMAAMAADPDVKAWWALTDAMQEPFAERKAGSWWLDLAEIFHLD